MDISYYILLGVKSFLVAAGFMMSTIAVVCVLALISAFLNILSGKNKGNGGSEQ